MEQSPVIYLNYKYLYRFFTRILRKCSIFTDDIELKIHQYKSITSISIQIKNQRCARLVSLFQLYPEHLALGCCSFLSSSPASICDVFAACRFSDKLPSETSMIRKPMRIMQNRKFLQHKFSAVGMICRMMATDAMLAIRHCSKSRRLTKSVGSETKP